MTSEKSIADNLKHHVTYYLQAIEHPLPELATAFAEDEKYLSQICMITHR